MKNTSVNFLLNDIEADDEIDELFSHLEQCVPPVDMVARIMEAAAQLPQPKPLSKWQNFDFFALDYNETQLC